MGSSYSLVEKSALGPWHRHRWEFALCGSAGKEELVIGAHMFHPVLTHAIRGPACGQPCKLLGITAINTWFMDDNLEENGASISRDGPGSFLATALHVASERLRFSLQAGNRREIRR